MKTSRKPTAGRVLSLALTGLILFSMLIAAGSAAEGLTIPETHRIAVVLNCFEDTWPTAEDGTDWVESVTFASDTDEFTIILDYFSYATFSSVFNTGNFTPDFSFTDGSDASAYDLKFFEDDRLILRDPAGECFTVDLDTDRFYALKELIGEMRLGIFYQNNPIAGGYTDDRTPSAEELEMFEAVTLNMVGALYEPELVATQVVAGINYRFTATMTPVVPDAQPQPVYVYIFQPLDGEPELMSVEDIETE